jgi:hypothetical protein
VFQNFLQERYYIFQELKNKTKTFWSVPNFFLAKQNFLNVLKNLKTKQINLLVKKNILDLKENFLV